MENLRFDEDWEKTKKFKFFVISNKLDCDFIFRTGVVEPVKCVLDKPPWNKKASFKYE